MPPETEEATLRVTHYTSLAAVTSMLRALTEGQEASLRLYDSVHCNDPDEGNYLVRGLSSDSTHRWLARGSAAGHAYITSFVDGQGKPDMSDDLVFWGPYGKDGSGCSMTLNVSQTLLRKVLYGPANVGVAKKTLKSVLDPGHSNSTGQRGLCRSDFRDYLAASRKRGGTYIKISRTITRRNFA